MLFCWLSTLSETVSGLLSLTAWSLLFLPKLFSFLMLYVLPKVCSLHAMQLLNSANSSPLKSRQRRAYRSGFTHEFTKQSVLQKANIRCCLSVRITMTSTIIKDRTGSQQTARIRRIRLKVRASWMSIRIRACPFMLDLPHFGPLMAASCRFAFNRMRA